MFNFFAYASITVVSFSKLEKTSMLMIAIRKDILTYSQHKSGIPLSLTFQTRKQFTPVNFRYGEHIILTPQFNELISCRRTGLLDNPFHSNYQSKIFSTSNVPILLRVSCSPHISEVSWRLRPSSPRKRRIFKVRFFLEFLQKGNPPIIIIIFSTKIGRAHV